MINPKIVLYHDGTCDVCNAPCDNIDAATKMENPTIAAVGACFCDSCLADEIKNPTKFGTIK